MKKLLFFLTIISFFSLISCSSDENMNEGGELTLKNYKLTFPSGTVSIHSFDNSKGVDEVRDGKLARSFKYTNDKLTEYATYFYGGDVNDSYIFEYDTQGKLTTVKEKGIYSGAFGQLSSDETYVRVLNYTNNIISSDIPDYKVEITLNDIGLIKEFKKVKTSNNELDSQFKFSYDSNENCTGVKIKFILGGDVYERELSYSYDDKKNPLYKHYKNSYLPYLIIHGKFNFFGDDITSYVRTFGKNNIIQVNDAKFEYEYNSSNYPIKVTVRQIGTNELSYTGEFNY